MISSSNQRRIGIALQYIQMGLGIIIQLLYTSIMLKILGANEYGIYNIASSTIAYLSLLSLGFGSSYIRYYSIYKNKEDTNGIKKLNGLYILVFSFIGIIALIVGGILSINAGIFLNDTYSIQEIGIAKVLMAFLTINLAISFPASVFVSYISSQERFIFQKIVNMGKTILGPAFNIVVLYLGYGSIGMVIVTTLISLIVDVVNVYFCLSKLNMKFSFRNPNLRLLKDIFAFSIFIAINQIIDQINWQTDKLILGKFVNGTSVAIYAVASNINTMFTNFSTSISSVFAPKVNRIVSKNEPSMDFELTKLFIQVGRVQWFVLALILSGYIFFGQYFIKIWAGTEYSNAYWVGLLLMAPAVIALIQNVGIEIQRAKNKHQFRSIVYLFMAFLNVGISIWFAFLWQEIGVAIGTTISLIVANGLIMNVYYHKKLGINILCFWKSILQSLPCLVLPIIAGICVLMFLSFNSIFEFAICILGYTFIYLCSVYLLGFNAEERGFIKTALTRLSRRKNA